MEGTCLPHNQNRPVNLIRFHGVYKLALSSVLYHLIATRVMADIAMLVAEEYERRVKSSRKDVGENKNMDLLNWASSHASLMAQSVRNMVVVDDDDSDVSNKNLHNLEFPKWALEPRSKLGVAASNGVFSA
ncbi:hypothetical protein K2173_005286 [Erythroxylum novogranatense]|uniref:Uncharacterized protein n=1 Tax=Erythroxylum novogranatense TaxID=1862640 RepID=A0AAV8TVB8_9ROSI|nr:hypothetical protein K2173_005286 [Erythroxylum novogranatense]